jgi:hypothetical protein
MVGGLDSVDVRRRAPQTSIAGQPVQARNHDGQDVDTSDGPFLRSDLPVAGFAVIEAASLDEALSLASKTPCAVARGVVEVWPLKSTP